MGLGRSDALNLDGRSVATAGRPSQNRIITFASTHGLPAISISRTYVDDGGLMSYGPNINDLCRRGAVYVDKILRGTKPADLPVEQAIQFELVLNLRTAKALGVEIPPTLLAVADEVIE